MAEKAKIETLPSAADIYLFHEGTNYRSYSLLGAHTAAEEGVTGVRFTVWAPHATYVGLAGDHNDWDGTQGVDSLYKIPDSGFWSRFFREYSRELFTNTGFLPQMDQVS